MDKSGNSIETNKNDKGIRANHKFLNFIEVKVEKEFSPKMKGKFLLIKYDYDENREEEFLDFILDNLTNYALSKKERETYSESLEKIHQLWKTTVRRFVKNSKTGEFGEIILFHLLELLENAVQIVNKMTLKTSGGVHYHGADAIHFGVNGGLKILFLGESKTAQKKFSEVLESALESINSYDKSDKQFDIDLATGNLSEDIPDKYREEIKHFLNPSKKDLTNFTITHAVLLMFEDNFLAKLEETFAGKELLQQVLDKYHKDIEEYINIITKKIEEYDTLKNRRFLFFVIPYKDLKKLKQAFSEVIKSA